MTIVNFYEVISLPDPLQIAMNAFARNNAPDFALAILWNQGMIVLECLIPCMGIRMERTTPSSIPVEGRAVRAEPIYRRWIGSTAAQSMPCGPCSQSSSTRTAVTNTSIHEMPLPRASWPSLAHLLEVMEAAIHSQTKPEVEQRIHKKRALILGLVHGFVFVRFAVTDKHPSQKQHQRR